MIDTFQENHPNYPRPTMFREGYTMLNGQWDFCFDQDDIGLKHRYFEGFKTSLTIQVPFSYQTRASGIHKASSTPVIWYQRIVLMKKEDAILHFEGVDGEVSIYLNGHLLFQGIAGYSRLSLPITEYKLLGDNLIVIRVFDDFNTSKPRGKQRWQDQNFGCWYQETSGIYKSVWLEALSSPTSIKTLLLKPDVALRLLDLNVEIRGPYPGVSIEVITYYRQELVHQSVTLLNHHITSLSIAMRTLSAQFKIHCWTPDTPFLYDINIRLIKDGKVIDELFSYVAMRDIKVLGSSILLNHEPIYLKMILDQGYWPESGLTPPTLEALEKDILLMKQSGFNGVRKHQKIEDERFYHLADRLGLLVWLEMPSHYEFDYASMNAYFDLLPKVLDQHQNYQSIIAYVLFNESWGLPSIAFDMDQQQNSVAAYHLAKAKATGRLIIGNDGWEHTVSDLITLHHYTQSSTVLQALYQDVNVMFDQRPHQLPMPRLPFAQGFLYQGQPIIISEFAGIASVSDEGWGYGDKVTSKDGYYQRLFHLTKTLLQLPHLQGYCVTQLTDVEQETNGLFTADRKAKLSVEIYRRINEGIYES